MRRRAGKAVLGVMHHGVLGHYKGQQKFTAVLVDDWPMIAGIWQREA